MLNKYYIGGDTTNVKCEVNLNQPSTGFIQKSNPISRFIRFQRGSEIERLLFPTESNVNPRLYYTKVDHVKSPGRPWAVDRIENKVYEDVTVLQVCIFGNDYMLAEYVFNKDMKEQL
jgi:hypothetical protein